MPGWDQVPARYVQAQDSYLQAVLSESVCIVVMELWAPARALRCAHVQSGAW